MDFSLLNNDGISPTVGVILMVAITVVLAVTVGAMVLDIGSSTSQNAQAGVTMQETSNGVEVKVNSLGGNTDELEVLVNGTVEKTITSVGTYEVTASSGVVVSVRGVTESGTESVIQSVTVSNPGNGGPASKAHPNAPGGDLNAVLDDMEGEGTSDKPYIITNDHELQAMNENTSAHYKLGKNIDASKTSNWNDGKGFDPIGKFDAIVTSISPGDVYASGASQFNLAQDTQTKFTGELNGNGYEIHGLTIDRSGEETIGLIGFMSSTGSVTDIGIVNADITGSKWVGGLVGINDGGSVKKSYATGSVTGSYGGGLVGDNGGSVSNSYATGNVSGDTNNVGGLIGSNKGSVSNSYATGNVSGEEGVGGLIGVTQGSVSNSYATGKVSGENSVGGLIGVTQGSVSNSYWDTESTGQSSGIGGGSGSVTNVNRLTTSGMTGIAAKKNMSAFDWTDIWTTRSGDYPTLQ